MGDIPYLGELAGLITAGFFAVTATIFTFAGRLVGSELVNRMRLALALVLISGIHLVVYGSLVPLDAGGERWLWLGLSGVIGFALGDAFLFQAFLMIGPRLGMLLMSLAPVMAALLGWWFLGETLDSLQAFGIALTVAGVAWVAVEKREGVGVRAAVPVRRSRMRNAFEDNRAFILGLLCGVLAAAGQAGGAVLSKLGLADDFPPISGNLIRILAATACIWTYYGLRGKIPESFEKLRASPASRWLLLGGAIAGPVVGVSFSLLAIQNTAVGVASTLIATTPVFMLPVGYFVFKDRFGWQAVAGTLLTMAGIALLFAGGGRA